jgi:hypothetical protein
METMCRNTAFVACLVLASLTGAWAAAAADTDPVGKAISLLSDLQAKVMKDGEQAHTEYGIYTEWCEQKYKDLAYEQKTEEAQVAALTATIVNNPATSMC